MKQTVIILFINLNKQTMADKLMIDINNIDKNSALFKKFLNSRNNQSPQPQIQLNQIKIKSNDRSPNKNIDTIESTGRNDNNYIQSKNGSNRKHRQFRNSNNKHQQRQYEPIVTYQRGILTQKIQETDQYISNSFQQPLTLSIQPIQQSIQPIQQSIQPIEKLQQQQKDREAYTLQDYRRKYQKIQLQYEQLRNQTLEQNKIRKKQLIQQRQKTDLIKQRLYEIQTHEDQLILENQKLKQKIQQQSLIRVKLQQENKESGYKIQEMMDMLQGKQNTIKKKIDQISYWKSQNESLKQQINDINLNNQKLRQHCHLIEGQHTSMKKQKQNKQYLIEDLREKITILISENSLLKDQMYTLTTKMYQLEQENQSLKADVRRDRQMFPPNYLQEQISSHQYHQRIPAFELNNIPTNENQRQVPTTRQRKRGQFAKQRATTKNIQKQTPQQQKKQQPVPRSINRQNTLPNRLQQLNQQLEKIKDMKAINGTIRRRKIQIERQIQAIQSSSRHQ